MSEIGQLRVWHNSNLGHAPFIKEVCDVEDAKFLLSTLANYDLYLGSLITDNAQGLEIYVGDVDYETNDGWEEWDNDGEDIGEIMRNEDIIVDRKNNSTKMEGLFPTGTIELGKMSLKVLVEKTSENKKTKVQQEVEPSVIKDLIEQGVFD